MSHRRRGGGEEGTSALELMMTISVIFLLMLAVIQVSLISITKLLTNYAAWSAARVWAVNEDDAEGKAKQAGVSILEIIDWGTIDEGFVTVQSGNEGVLVEYETTLGIPFLLKNNQAGRITTVGWGTVPRDPNGFGESGDNKE
jgi:Flp pilus assembly protein TadG